MRLGIDFDNTIVCYDALFHQVALERGLIPESLPRGKSSVRDYLRQTGCEDAWTELQGWVYGPRLREAAPYPGALAFLRACRGRGIPVCIISHKTRTPFRGEPHDLHAAARTWLADHGCLDPADIGLSLELVHFELTKAAKLERIAQCGCTHFIDDLPEFLAEPDFPPGVLRLLFDPNDRYATDTSFVRVTNWNELRDLLVDDTEAAADTARWRQTVLPWVRSQGVHGECLLQPLAGGANNRVFRLRAEGLDRVLKIFFQQAGDPRDRFGAERAFYSHLWERGIRSIPQPHGWDEARRWGWFEYLIGRKLRPEEVNPQAVGQALEFIVAANHTRHNVTPDALPVAAEACFSVAEHLALVDQRMARLRGIPMDTALEAEATAFVREELEPAWDRVRAAVHAGSGPALNRVLPVAHRCLSPSDFGFHNALLGTDGRLRFFDFEYAGWDDPAKLICDFFCQPQLPVNPDAWDTFVGPLERVFAQDGSLARRALSLLPVYRIKWCCIRLNDFLPCDRSRRAFALGPGADHDRKRAQLNRARQSLTP